MDVYCRVERWGEMYSHTQGEEEGNIHTPLSDIYYRNMCHLVFVGSETS